MMQASTDKRINFDALDRARKIYKKEEMPFLSEFRENVIHTRPYRGLKIFHSIPLTIEAVLKIETLLQGGAEVTASCVTALPPNPEAVAILQAAHVEVQLEHCFKMDYDFHLDCCGELSALSPPRRGAVELTQTGGEIYKKARLTYPVISVDDSPLKLLETLFGTGDGFTRALISSANVDLHNKKFVIFGYGKVGRGIVQSLIKFTDKIVVIDKGEAAMETALARGIKYVDYQQREVIKAELQDSHYVATATGIKNLLTDFYQFCPADFNGAILANMGAYDEFGDNFGVNDVLFEKKPLNFSTAEPTTMKYLDPVLYAHNIAIDYILSGTLQPGWHPFPASIAKDILNHWAYLQGEESFNVEEYFM